MKRKYLIGLIPVVLYLILAMAILPNTGIAWDETRYFASAKARAYSIYSWATGSPGLEMCSLEEVQQNPDNWGRCWDGRPRLSQTFSGLTWAGIWFLNGRSLDVMSSAAAHRISTIILTMIGIFILFLFATEAFGLNVGIFSSLALIFIPRFFAHSHYATMDVPVAVMSFLTIYLFWKGLRSWKFGLLAGIVFGLALATKINAYFIPFILLIWLVVSYRDRVWKFFMDIKKRVFKPRSIPLVFYSIILLPLIVLVLAWPWLWIDTIPRFIDYMLWNLVHTEGTTIFYMGQSFIDLPWHYSWAMMLFTLPIPIIIFSLIGGLKGIRDTLSNKNRTSFLIITGALFMPILFTLPIASPHDGVRLYMLSFPFIAILAGLGADWLLSFAGKYITKRNIMMLAAVLLALLIVIPGLHAVSRGHSSTATYYNELIGGPEGAYRNGFQVEYWGEAYLDAVKWLNQNGKENAALYVPMAWNIFNTYRYGDIGQIGKRTSEGRHDLNYSAFQSLGGQVFEQYGLLRNDFRLVNESADADYTILLMRRCVIEGSGELKAYLRECEPLHSIMPDGAPLVIIYDAGCV